MPTFPPFARPATDAHRRPEELTYAAERGAGWRADCLGDMGGFSKTWCHMCDAYPKLIPEAGVGDLWKTAPVAWRAAGTCGGG